MEEKLQAEIVQAAFVEAPYNIALMEVAADGSYGPVATNPATLRSFGLSEDTDANTGRFNPETDREIRARLKACFEAGHPLEFEEQLLIGDREIWTQAIYTPVSPGANGDSRVLITSFDISERKQKQIKEIEEREVIIEQQMLTLAEISTPLLTLSDDVVLLPLIGAIDSRRAQQIMEALLTGIAENRAKVAIIDITGVAVVDTQVANALLHAAQAAQLLGARVILTGIRPEIAQTMVGLGIDLNTIITRSTLQSAIAFSLSKGALAERLY